MAAEQLLAAKRASDQTESTRSAIEKIRSRTDLTAKGLVAVGTAAVTAIGYTEFVDVFPYGGPWWAAALLVVGVIVMLVAVLVLSKRFSDASEVIATSVDLERTISLNGFDSKEEEIVRSVYEGTADLNGVDSLSALQERGHRFERIADRLEPNDPLVDPLRERADLLMHELRATQARVGALILKKRAKEATSGRRTVKLVVLFVLGWYLTAYSSDRLESERTGKIEVAKACADARTAGAQKLPSICDGQEPKKEEPTATETLDASAVAIAEGFRDCRKAAAKAGEDPNLCLALRRALVTANSESRTP